METSRAALLRNAALLRALAPAAKLMAVVKANAYGHGTAGMVPALAPVVDMFGVANLAEARDVAALAPGVPVMILGAVLPSERAAVVSAGFVAVVSSAAEVAEFARHGRATVHLAVDTGMGRMGVWESDALAELCGALAVPGVNVAGLCSHLPVADEDESFTRDQLARFQHIAEEARRIAGRRLLIHVENSAGLIRFPRFAPDIFRAGLAIYGVSPVADFQSQLRPALTWKSRVVLVREIGAGRGISYGRTFVTSTPMRVATVAIGYADGFPRQVSGRGAAVLIGGKRCAVLGRVTMDQIMVDVTGGGAEPGDEVVILGRQGAEEITAGEMASLAGTISWDVLTGIGGRVVRIFVN